MKPFGKWTNIPQTFAELQLMPVQNMIKFATCKLGYNVLRKQYPEPILKLFDKFGGQKVHHYPTRNKHIPNLQQGYSEQYRTAFFAEYNNLPTSLKTTTSVSLFLSQLKSYLIS